jgi:hypothetical protein
MEGLNEKIDGLHKRMDRFFEWAGSLQKEYRNMQINHTNMHVRLSFIENQCLGLAEFTPANDDVLFKRLEQVKK